MKNYRIIDHPILAPKRQEVITFFWKGAELKGLDAETISSALFANGIRTFGYHIKDGAPLGIFCANGQCSQCTVLANGLPVKACVEVLRPEMQVEPVRGNPALPKEAEAPNDFKPTQEVEIECLIIGGGPAGLAAAIELGKVGADVLIVDDKQHLGGKLVLQTHRFFGSINACYAGTRGIDIASRLEKDVRKYRHIDIWMNSTAIAVFSDGKAGVLREGREYVFIRPKTLLVAAGAREKSLVFKGNTLPGVYGAGAFQTLVNRDLVRCAERLFIVGGGNVGLIAAYHALQAGIEVVGLIEALPECGGYKVHKDKLLRFGVPIYTSHTVLSANGEHEVESVTISQIDKGWKAIPGTEKTFACDTILIAVGLNPVDEFFHKAKGFGMPVFAAGDAEEIAEASSAMFSGKIKGLEIAKSLGYSVGEIPPDWRRTAEVLKSRGGTAYGELIPETEEGVIPVLHCDQEIPCNPCTSVCPLGDIYIDPDDIRQVPEYIARRTGKPCIGCEKCVTICPGLAITLIDYRKGEDPLVTIAYEFGKGKDAHKKGDIVTVLDIEGNILGNVEVLSTRMNKATDRTVILKVRAPHEYAKKIAGVLLQNPEVGASFDQYVERLTDDMIVCRCERVTMKEIKEIILTGSRDVNEIKTISRAGMGACGGKTCETIIMRAFKDLGVPEEEVTPHVQRPLFIEASFGILAGVESEHL